jgi:hypothetical protein
MAAKFEILKQSDGQYYWRFKGGNGEIVCHSEGYTTKASAQTGIDSVKTNAASAAVDDKTV